MSKKAAVNKSQAVRNYLSDHPQAMPKEVQAALAEQGINVSRVLVSTVKATLPKRRRKATRKSEPVVEPAAVPVEATKPSGMVTLDLVKKVATTVSALGGYQRMTELLEVIKEAGGLKKFRDLAEAIACPQLDVVAF
jgi:hypothetical protein